MEDLLADIGADDSFGLNLVCDTSSLTRGRAENALPAKKKKRNKYERRREASRRAKEEKIGGAKVDRHSDVVTHQNARESEQVDREATTEIDAERPITAELDLATEKVPKEKELIKNSNDGPEKPGNSQTSDDDVDARKAPVPDDDNMKQKAISRKTHDVELLRDERKRAEYMATFHARPHESDRRSGASKMIKRSHASNHIFDGNGNVGELSDASEDVNEKEDKKPHGNPFEALGLHLRLANAVSSERGPFGYKRPTTIQTNAALALLGSPRMKKSRSTQERQANLFVQSETGSGKTLAYLLPIVQCLAVDRANNDMKKVDRRIGGTRCLILCPTRELATQTATIAEKLCLKSFNWLVPGCLSGGEKRKSEKARLRKGVSILVATPGRLLDHLGKTDCLSMALKGKLEWIVLDEADRLLDMGLGGQVEEIVQKVRANQPKSGPNRDGITWRSALVSATVTQKIESLAKKMLGGKTWVWARAKNGKLISDSRTENNDGQHELAHSAPHQLAQLHITVNAKLRLSTLVAFLAVRVQKCERAVIFMSTCNGVEFYHSLFSKMGSILPKDDDSSNAPGIFGDACSMYRLHGNVPHSERQAIMKKFSDDAKHSSKKASILIATDVAARGLNLPDLDWIVQYDAPSETADYVHRAGRAARAGKAGHALLFLLPSEQQFLEVLQLRGLKNITALSLAATLNGAASLCKDLTAEGQKHSGGGYGSGSGSREGEAFAAAVQNRLEECILADDETYKTELAEQFEQRKVRGAQKKLKNAMGDLHTLAVQAFSSQIRSYPAKEKAVRHIFSPRALHLGHIARSFALKEQPKALSGKRRELGDAKEEEEDFLKSTGRKRNSKLAFGDKGKGTDGERLGGTLESDSSSAAKKKVKKSKNFAVASDLAAFEDIKGKIKKRSGDFTSKEKSTNTNAQARMLAMAQRMQNGGSEFF